MGLFSKHGWFNERTKAAGHAIEKGIDSATYNLFGKGIITGRKKDQYGVYVGYDSNNGFSLSTPYFGPDADKFYGPTKGGNSSSGNYNYGYTGGSTTNAYKANAAGTANKIAQGGMTKDDILKYNIKHPNEIAGDNPANTTALNTNTAIRSK